MSFFIRMDKGVNARRIGGSCPIAKKNVLNFRFHNPNTEEEAAYYILKFLMEANQAKISRRLEEEFQKNSGFQKE